VAEAFKHHLGQRLQLNPAPTGPHDPLTNLPTALLKTA